MRKIEHSSASVRYTPQQSNKMYYDDIFEELANCERTRLKEEGIYEQQPLTVTEVLSQMPSFTLDDCKSTTVTCTLWKFNWNSETCDIVNTHEFRAAAEDKLSKQFSRFCTVYALERDTEVSADGMVVKDMAILNVTFSKDGPCDNCGEHTKNGRMTCLCWADEEDIVRMNRDAALHR